MSKIRELRKNAGMPQAQLAERIGTTQPQIFKLETGKLQLSKDWAKRIAKVFGIEPSSLVFGENISQPSGEFGLRVEGVVEAGRFRDISLVEDNPDEREFIPAARDPRYPHANQYALRVSGDSMDEIAADGSYVTCVCWPETGLALEDRMVLHVERHVGPLVENTLKRYVIKGGKKWLCPESSNKKHAAIEIDGDESAEFVIKGLMIGMYSSFDYRS